MPFIVTTKRLDLGANTFRVPGPASPDERFDVARQAVATLEEARQAAQEPCGNDLMARLSASLIPESGGTVTLPDGTVIEVKPTVIEALATAMRWSSQEIIDHTDDQILDAFNARESGQGKGATR